MHSRASPRERQYSILLCVGPLTTENVTNNNYLSYSYNSYLDSAVSVFIPSHLIVCLCTSDG